MDCDKFEIGENSINSLFWADDLVLLSKSEDNLTKLLKILEEYSCENELEINTKKTKCMIFNKTGRLIRRSFYINGAQLENVRGYKYLGFKLTPSGEITSGLQDLRDRGLKAYMKVKQDLGNSFNQEISIILSLIDTLIKPILLYASDFWGCLNLPSTNPIENLHMMMCKQILGVQKQTTNIGVLLELGRVPLHLYAKKFAIRNWERVKRGQANTILLSSYSDSINENLPWTNGVRSILESNGMLSFYTNDYTSTTPFIAKRIFERIVDSFHQNSFTSINSTSSKLRTYAIFKKDIGLEKYLSDVKNFEIRRHVTKFRLSNHRLMIEVGRHLGIKNEKERFCPFCSQKVENEFHFLLECDMYKQQRELNIKPITDIHHGFKYLQKSLQIEFLMASMDQNICNYISNCFEIRSFLEQNHKRVI